jgi:hypothetical protein
MITMTTVDHQPPPAGRHAAPEDQPPAAPTPGPADRRLLWIAALVLAAIVGVALFLVTARDVADDLRGHPAASHERHRVSGAAHGRSAATLDLVSGASSVTVRSGDLGSDMYRVSTPEGAAPLPAVADQADRVEVRLTGGGEGGRATLLVELSNRVAWQVRLGGGANAVTLDLRSGGLAGVDVATGVGSIEMSLPAPHGTVRVAISGGAASVAAHLPSGVPARLRVGGGAATATVDGAAHSGVSGGSVYTTSGYDTATDRYDLDATSGVSTIVVDHS